MVSAGWYAGVLDSLYTLVEGLDTTPYRGVESDRWTRARRLPTADDVGHLLTYIWLDGVTADHQWALDRSGRLAFVHRYSPDDDSTSQSQLHAAEDHVMDALLGWQDARGGRVINITNTKITQIDEQWTGCVVSFTIRLPRG